MRNFNLTKIDNITKILLIILVIAVSYFLIFLTLRPFFAPKSMIDMMNQIGSIGTETIIPLIIALVIGIIISFYLFRTETKDRDFNIIRRILSEDEKKVLDEIKKTGDITQDSLRFRLDWSKAKISTILTNLDKKGLVQRERVGKTYKIYLQRFKTV